MIFAGLKPDGSRVAAAVNWARQHDTPTENPGLGEGGLHSDLQRFAKALDTLGQDKFTDTQGTVHDWRRELIDELAKRQRSNESWLNTNSRWMEGDPNLVTGYPLTTLSYSPARIRRNNRESSHQSSGPRTPP